MMVLISALIQWSDDDDGGVVMVLCWHTLTCCSGVPAVVDFAAMRDAVMKLGGDPEKINPVCPADLVIDHSIQVDFNRK